MNDLQIPEFMIHPVKTLDDLEREASPKKPSKRTRVYEIEKTVIRPIAAFMVGMFLMYWIMI